VEPPEPLRHRSGGQRIVGRFDPERQPIVDLAADEPPLTTV